MTRSLTATALLALAVMGMGIASLAWIDAEAATALNGWIANHGVRLAVFRWCSIGCIVMFWVPVVNTLRRFRWIHRSSQATIAASRWRVAAWCVLLEVVFALASTE